MNTYVYGCNKRSLKHTWGLPRMTLAFTLREAVNTYVYGCNKHSFKDTLGLPRMTLALNSFYLDLPYERQ